MNDSLLLPLFSLFIVLAILVWAVSVTHSDLSTPKVGLSCSTGQCTVNRINGIKICPENDGESLEIDPLTEVCSDKFACSNGVVPFAVQSDMSTLEIGDPNINVCPDNTACRCVGSLQCADFVTSYFIIQNSDTNQSISNSRTVFNQSALYQPSFQGATQTDAKPMILTDSETMVCSVSQQVIDNDRMWPNRCVSGTLAYVVDSAIGLTQDDLEVFPLSCVVGSECPPGGSAVYDKQVGKVVCVTT